MISNKEKAFLSVVVYVNNSEATIYDFLQKLFGVLDNNFEKYEIICVNDASSDNSISIIRGAAEYIGGGILSIVNMSYYQGLEASMNAGVDIAIGDFVFEFDSNALDYDMKLIIDVYRHLLEGYDIVAASNLERKFSSALFYALFNRNANIQYELHTETFRLLSRRAINRTYSMSKTIPYRKALYANCGLKIDTLFYESRISITTTNSKRIKKYRHDTAFNSLILFTDVAYKIAFILATIMMAATLAGVIYTAVIYLHGKPIEGYTTIMLVANAAFFGVFAILAVIIKYLAVLVNLVFKEQKYIIESVEKISK